MSKKWTIESAKAYVNKVQKGKQQSGLTYCSAIDFLMNHTNLETKTPTLVTEEDSNDNNKIDS
jgi:hypothetical protein